jgi:predicted phosphodiesterase
MRILHLSDLHETHDGVTLPELWERAQPVIAASSPFDFVVITGDLTQRADPKEYTALHHFLEAEIEPLVNARGGPVKPRVIMVPGNHDVTWGVTPDCPEMFETIALSDADPEEVAKVMRDAMLAPGQHRYKIGRLGHLSAFRIKQDLYPKRFAAVAAFFRDYYGTYLEDPHHPFNLLQPKGEGDWAVHVFREERVAFLGFNSCFQNDRYWHGAQINESAMRFARRYLDRIDPKGELLRIAVWHHGLESHRTRPDRLTLSNLAAIVGTGAKVGFHGHVHKANSEILRLIADDFALVSTGSLGAGSLDRPDAVGNQFSVVDVHWNRLRVKIFESRDRGPYEESSRQFHMYFDPERPFELSEPVRSTASHVIRHLTLTPEDGVATILVELHDLELREEIALAQFDRSFTSDAEDVYVDGHQIPIRAVEVDGAIEYRFEGISNRKSYKKLTWRYRIANSLALDASELEHLPSRRATYPNIRPGHEAWSHVVQFDYDRLTMRLSVGGESPYRTQAAEASVEQRAHSPRWVRLDREEARCEHQVLADGFQLSWASPIAGNRYGATFEVAARSASLGDDDARNLEQIINVARSTRVHGELVRSALSDELDIALRECLLVPDDSGDDFLGETLAVGYLWHRTSRRLRPCFGFLPPDAWGTEFSSGRGIAGHAFRFGRPTGWFQGTRGDFDVIRVPTIPGTRDYQWILSVPLFDQPGGAAVGVIGFAAEGAAHTRAGNALAAFARRTARRVWESEDDGASTSEQFNDLWNCVNAALWTGLHEVIEDHDDLFDPDVQAMVRQCYETWVSVAASDEHR